ncbi:MAG: polyprenol monophosphomannose synthase [Candidatus Omnitrophica bacterium]|nr:polyprenol monophosphomannose synthase [Candidatus Omnitrophota bacterium]
MDIKTNKQKILIIIPTYNEIRNIANLIDSIYSLKMFPSVLVIDDNSPDGTSQLIDKIKINYPKLYLITREKRMGLSSAYIKGFKFALEGDYEIVIQMDADLSHQPHYIPEMVNLLSEYDLVIGSRYVKGGGTLNWELGRTLLSRLANIASKAMLRVPLNDLTSGFKCMRIGVLKGINFNEITSRGYSFQIEMVIYAFLKGFKITEYPIVFKGRKNEESKMSFGIAAEAFFKVIMLSLRRKISQK